MIQYCVFESQEEYDENENIIWLPLSQIIIDREKSELILGVEINIDIPEWLAIKAGLE